MLKLYNFTKFADQITAQEIADANNADDPDSTYVVVDGNPGEYLIRVLDENGDFVFYL